MREWWWVRTCRRPPLLLMLIVMMLKMRVMRVVLREGSNLRGKATTKARSDVVCKVVSLQVLKPTYRSGQVHPMA